MPVVPADAAAALVKAFQDNINHMADLQGQFAKLQGNFQTLVKSLPVFAPVAGPAFEDFKKQQAAMVAKEKEMAVHQAEMDKMKADLDKKAKELFVFPPVPSH